MGLLLRHLASHYDGKNSTTKWGVPHLMKTMSILLNTHNYITKTAEDNEDSISFVKYTQLYNENQFRLMGNKVI